MAFAITFPCGLIVKFTNTFWDYLGGNAVKFKKMPDECPMHGKDCDKYMSHNSGIGGLISKK